MHLVEYFHENLFFSTFSKTKKIAAFFFGLVLFFFFFCNEAILSGYWKWTYFLLLQIFFLQNLNNDSNFCPEIENLSYPSQFLISYFSSTFEFNTSKLWYSSKIFAFILDFFFIKHVTCKRTPVLFIEKAKKLTICL